MTYTVVPLKAIYRRVEERGRADLPLLSVYRDLGVVPREGREDNFNRASEDLSTYKVVKPGDLVVNKMKTWQGSLAVSSYEGIVSPAYFVGRRIAEVDDRYIHHLLRSQPLIAEYGARSKGIRPSQWDLPWGEFACIKVGIPELAVQRAVADFLDAETARIDALIEKKQRMIELLGFRRRSIIAEAVEGVQTNRDGDECHSIQLKRVLKFRNGQDYKAVEQEDGPYPVYGSGGEFARASGYLYDGESVLFGRKGTIDVPKYVSGRFWTVDTMYFTEVSSSVNARFLYYLAMLLPFEYYATATALPSMTQEALGSHRIVLPNLQRQHEIARDLDRRTSQLDALVAALGASITALKELRQTVISSMITGEWSPERATS